MKLQDVQQKVRRLAACGQFDTAMRGLQLIAQAHIKNVGPSWPTDQGYLALVELMDEVAKQQESWKAQKEEHDDAYWQSLQGLEMRPGMNPPHQTEAMAKAEARRVEAEVARMRRLGLI